MLGGCRGDIEVSNGSSHYLLSAHSVGNKEMIQMKQRAVILSLYVTSEKTFSALFNMVVTKYSLRCALLEYVVRILRDFSLHLHNSIAIFRKSFLM